MKHLQLLAAAVGLAAALTAGCDWHSPSEPESRDSLSVVSVDPPAGTRLVAGAPVTFTVTVDYQLRSTSVFGGDDGTITMDVEDQNGRDLDTEVSKRVSQGRGSTSLADHLKVPTAGVSQVRVVLTLIPAALDAQRLTTVAGTYPVGR